jgi:hypothetical protein
MARKKFSDVDLIHALNIHDGNATQAAKALGVTRDAVVKRRSHLPDGILAKDVTEFRSKRADTFAELQHIIMQYITPAKLKKASLSQLGTLFGIFYDKERLETNQPTELRAHAHINKMHPDDVKLVKELIRQKTQRRIAEAED